MSSLKRPLPEQLPTPEELVRVFKKHTRDVTKPKVMAQLPPPTAHERALDAPLRHAVPPTIMPVLAPPYSTQDFFSDLHQYSDEESLQRKAQINQIMHQFPPPAQPVMMGELVQADGGIAVPFIYPPVPPLRPDFHLNDTFLTPENKAELKPDTNAELRHQTYQPYQLAENKRLGMQNSTIWPVIPPLPFPPPNYMPYPLMALKAPFTPGELFDEWLVALDHLPRVDMVVASAAGSMVDIRTELEALGFDVEKLDRWMKERQQELDPEAEEGVKSELELDTERDDYASYVKQVDTTNVYDIHATDNENLLEINSDLRNAYLHVAPKTDGTSLACLETHEWSAEDIKEHAHAIPLPAYLKQAKDVANASGSVKDTRRQELLDTTSTLHRFVDQNREKIYTARKLELLERLKKLRNSNISLDDTKLNSDDPELGEFIRNRKNERDHELLRLKLYHNHEKLKAALLFYQSSNSTYKGLNRIIINKLRKLKHFLEHQQLVFAGTGPDAEIFNLRSKDSANLTNSFVEQDYSNEVKQIFRNATINEDRGENVPPDVDVANFNKVFTSREHSPLVHDFMPLATEEEFKLVTGDAPSKLSVKDQAAKAKFSKHQIFQSPLYDRMTSGLDSNASDSTASATKRRPGRRAAPKPLLGEEPSKERSEAALVAKIMKQFVGPAAANPDELSEDLDLMKVNTRWPVR